MNIWHQSVTLSNITRRTH